MITYRDMTFCASDCIQTRCMRHMSHTKDNTRDLPIAQADFAHDCPNYRAPSSSPVAPSTED